jgi:hypothetical protein
LIAADQDDRTTVAAHRDERPIFQPARAPGSVEAALVETRGCRLKFSSLAWLSRGSTVSATGAFNNTHPLPVPRIWETLFHLFRTSALLPLFIGGGRMSFVSIEEWAPAISRAVLRRDHVTGALFAATGGVIAFGALAYPLGSAMRMGPGYFPLLLGLVLVGLGGLVALNAERSDAIARVSWTDVSWLRPLALVSLSVVVFALVVEGGGLVAAVFGIVVVSGLAHRAFRWRDMLVLAALLAAGSVGVFVYGLRLPFQIVPL